MSKHKLFGAITCLGPFLLGLYSIFKDSNGFIGLAMVVISLVSLFAFFFWFDMMSASQNIEVKIDELEKRAYKNVEDVAKAISSSSERAIRDQMFEMRTAISTLADRMLRIETARR